MKRVFLLISLLVACQSVMAQFYTVQEYKSAIRFFNKPAPRREIILPQVDGYTLYKADFHTHTIYSDGDVHSYFNPYGSAYEAFINYMNVLSDFQIEVEKALAAKKSRKKA